MVDAEVPAALVLSRSIWLPVGRANFYSYSANGWLVHRAASSGGLRYAYSDQLRPGYTPLLQVSVLRRLLEVLPRSFGYEAVGVCEFSGDEDQSQLSRPIAVTLTLDFTGEAVPCRNATELEANADLAAASVSKVQLRADEDGFYVFTVTTNGDPQQAAQALDVHVATVFGGNFSLEWQSELLGREQSLAAEGDDNDADAPAPTYNGLPENPDMRDVDSEYRPLGILTFFQLNTLFEGIFNDALTPAVFFEQHAFLADYRQSKDDLDPIKRTTSILRTVSDVVALLRTNGTTSAEDKAVTLRHFLAVTSRESLQKLKWSVESVRRGLLDEMMGILHRQSRLVQLKLDRAGYAERTPELAVGANESQLRGYAMLAGAKLPLVANIHRFASTAAAGLVIDQESTGQHAKDLEYRLGEWEGLLAALRDNINGLERAVEHAWMERMLYEQEQARAEQEAMAEIERSRRHRPVAGSGTGGTYNALMLFFTIVAVLITAATLPNLKEGESFASQARTLAPIAVVAVILSLLVLVDWVRRALRDLRGDCEGQGYEFAFRLDLIADPANIESYMANGDRGNSEAEEKDRELAKRFPSLRSLKLTRRGGARIECISLDATLVKIHSVVSFRTKRPGQLIARTVCFEVINEFLARKVSDKAQYVLRESRVFGDSPRLLERSEILGLVTFVLERSALTFQAENTITRERVLRYAKQFFNQ